MLIACTVNDIKNIDEELERQQEAQHPFYLEDSQEEYMRRWYSDMINLENRNMSREEYEFYYGTTGDAALDDDEEYCSEMDECLIPGHVTDLEEELGIIDNTEEINLSDLYSP